MRFFNNTEIAIYYNPNGASMVVSRYSMEAFYVWNSYHVGRGDELNLNRHEQLLKRYGVTLVSRGSLTNDIRYFVGAADIHIVNNIEYIGYKYGMSPYVCPKIISTPMILRNYKKVIEQLYKLQFFLMDKFNEVLQ